MKKITLVAVCLALLFGVAVTNAGAAQKGEILELAAEKVDGKIYVTATVKDVTFNAMQFRIGYDKRRLIPCDIETGEPTNDAIAMARYEQEEYDAFSSPNGWADYIGMLDTASGAVEYIVSVTPSVLGSGLVNDEGYVAASKDGLRLLTMCFLPTEGETLYEDSISLSGSKFAPTGLVIATDELNEHGVVVGITDGSRVKIDLSKVAERGKTPDGSGIPETPTEVPPTTPGGEDNKGGQNQDPFAPAEELSDSIVDITGHWAENSIRTLIDYGIFTGYGDKTFRPNQPLTRAEFAIVMVRSLGLETTSEPSVFSDCSGYAVPYVNAVKEAGLMLGVDGKGNFQPDRNITREETVSVVAKALGISGGETLSVADRNEISPWALDGVTAAVNAGIVQGRPEGFAPKANITRAEIAKIIAGLI